MANGIIEQIQLPNGDIYDIGGSGVTGVKGNNESVYRTGDVNLTAANIGAISVTGDTISGTIDMVKAAGISDLGYYVNNTSKGHKIGLIIGGSNGNAGLADVTKQKWIVYSDINGNVTLNGNALTVDQDGNLVISGSYTGTGEGLTNVIEIVRLT